MSGSLWKLHPGQTEQTHSLLVRPLNEKIIARPRIVVEMPFSLRLPAASAADALCVMRSLSAAGLIARGLLAGCKTRRRRVKWSECKAHSRHLNQKKLLQTRAPDNEIIMRPFSRIPTMHSLLMRMQPTRVHHAVAVRRHARYNFICCLTNVSFKYTVYVHEYLVVYFN